MGKTSVGIALATPPRPARTPAQGAVSNKISIPPMRRLLITVGIESLSMLVMHAFSKEAKGKIDDKHEGRAALPPGFKDPQQEFARSLHIAERNAKGEPITYGMPTVCFMHAMATAAQDLDKYLPARVRRCVHIQGDKVIIRDREGKPAQPIMRDDLVRINRKPATAYRGSFPEWTAAITMEIDGSVFTVEQMVTLLDRAGNCGVGEDRPSKRGGSWGRWRVRRDSVVTVEQ